MASSGVPVSLLHFQLPQSPLLSGCVNFSDDFFSTLSAQGICSPLPTFSFASPRQPARSPRSPTSTRSCPSGHPVRRRQRQDKPLPAVPPPLIPPKQIIALLNLLERTDDDITKDVHRVREAIREVRGDIAVMRAEQQAEASRRAERRAQEKRETKGVDDDFWLNA
ncbi:hypothetical protein EIP86_004909 [Pleurotus ostreatoroseus]|nr:hypothetical protein EIP86_004909 [Pleurotus ostreatoroseus]